MNKKIQDVLEEKSFALEAVLSKANHLSKLQELVKKALPDDLKAHIVVGGYTGAVLVLIADSPTWATKCRFMAPTLLQSLKKIEWLSTLGDISVKTGFMESPVEPSTNAQIIQKTATRPPEAIQKQFAQLAEDESNPRLKKILLRLAGK